MSLFLVSLLAVVALAQDSSLAERVDRASARYLGAPYVEAPLGEGPAGKYDQSPMHRSDGFDCTTFVETVMAQALARAPGELEAHLVRIRYRDGRAVFAARNHFPCADWIPNNVKAGYVADVTAKYGAVKIAKAVVTKAGWYKALPDTVVRVPGLSPEARSKLLTELRAEGAAFAPQEVALPYLPLADLLTRREVPPEIRAKRAEEEAPLKEDKEQLYALKLKHLIEDVTVSQAFLDAVPTATILNVVRPTGRAPGTPLLVSHQGLVIRKKSGPYFRHVSRSGGGRVKDVPLANYLRLCLLSPQIKGINLLEIRRP